VTDWDALNGHGFSVNIVKNGIIEQINIIAQINNIQGGDGINGSVTSIGGTYSWSSVTATSIKQYNLIVQDNEIVG